MSPGDTIHRLSPLTVVLSYQGNSPQCASLAEEISRKQRAQDPDTLLLILDRRDDLITPTLLPVSHCKLLKTPSSCVMTVASQPMTVYVLVDLPSSYS
jgi:hypothetical protein